MKTFEHFNQSTICPICGTKDDKTAVLIPIDDTDNEGICEGMQVHFDCIRLRVKKSFDSSIQTIIYQAFDEIGNSIVEKSPATSSKKIRQKQSKNLAVS
jgi:hypothetical protein